jgi:hypothetical protein
MGVPPSSKTLDQCHTSQLAANHAEEVTRFLAKVNAGQCLVSVKMDNLNKTSYCVVPKQDIPQGISLSTLTNMLRSVDTSGGWAAATGRRPPTNKY